MKQSLNKDTLAYQLGMRPALQHRDMSAIPLPGVVSSMLKYENDPNIYSFMGVPIQPIVETPMGNAEVDGLIFYTLNHAVSLVRQRVHVYEPLGKYLPILEKYHVEMAVRAARMFYYLLLICTREGRHEKGGTGMHTLYTKYGPVITDFFQGNLHVGEDSAVNKLRNKPPTVALGAYTSFLADVFYKGAWSSGYGGKKWGAVADVLRDFSNGKLTAEMMMDVAFTLCHNGGPIFNKGMLFDGGFPEIMKMLDVQRSGQIPQLVCEQAIKSSKAPNVQGIWKFCKDILGKEFEGYVDWYLVEELGSKHQYPTEKAQQTKLHGFPSKFKAKKEAEIAKQEIAAQEKVLELKSMVEILPGQFIKKVKRS